jgi:hypothetical protein
MREARPELLPTPNNHQARKPTMTNKTFILTAIASCAWIACSFAATIPAGATLVVRTVDTVSSHDRVGRTFTTQLDQDVAVNGKAVLRAGTKVFGRIEASRANPRQSTPLTLNLTGVSVNGRTVPIKTVGGFEPENTSKPRTTRGARTGVSVGSFTVPPGTKMEFRLAQPLNL